MGSASRKQKPAKAKRPVAGSRARPNAAGAKKTVSGSKPASTGKTKIGASARAVPAVKASGGPTKGDARSDAPRIESRVDAKSEARPERPDMGRDGKGEARPVSKNGVVKPVAAVRAEVEPTAAAERVPPPLPVPIASFTF